MDRFKAPNRAEEACSCDNCGTLDWSETFFETECPRDSDHPVCPHCEHCVTCGQHVDEVQIEVEIERDMRHGDQ